MIRVKNYTLISKSAMMEMENEMQNLYFSKNDKYNFGKYKISDFKEFWNNKTFLNNLENIFLEFTQTKHNISDNEDYFRKLMILSTVSYFKKITEISLKEGKYLCSDLVKDFFDRFHHMELSDILLNFEMDFSDNYHQCFSKFINNKEFVIKMLEKNNFGEKHDKILISEMNSFFYNDSHELRELIMKKPIIYDKLAKIGNKPNFSNEFVKELIYIYGSKFFVNRLSQELKNDKELMDHIIIEDATNLFRGNSNEYQKRIKENAFFLFSDKETSILNSYGMEYILERVNYNFFDFYEMLNPMFKKGMKNTTFNLVFDKFLTDEEKEKIALRGQAPEDYYRKSDIINTDSFEEALIQCFNSINYEYSNTQINYIMNKFSNQISDTYYKMKLAYNIAISYKNNTIEEFEWLISNLKTENKYFASEFNAELFTKEDYKKIGLENVLMMAHYPYSFYILSQLKKDNMLDIYAELLKNKPESKMAPANDINVLLYSCYTYSDAINDLKNKGQLNSSSINQLLNITKNNKLLSINTSDDIINYETNLIKFCDDNIKNCKDVNYAKELFFARFLKTNRHNAQDIIMKYKFGLKELNNPYCELLEILQLIDSMHDIDNIIALYSKMQRMDLFNKKSVNDYEELFKREIIGDNYIITSKLNGTKNENRTLLKDLAPKGGVEAFWLDPNTPFDILVHAVGAYGDNPTGETLKDTWNTKEFSYSSGICTTLINNTTMQTAMTKRSDSTVLFGFLNNLPANEILECGPYDLWSRTDKITPDSYFQQEFHNSAKMPENCRGARGSYNEVVITRYHNEQKRQPDYIVCFLHQTSRENIEQSMKVAKMFGIPFVMIDEQKFLDIETKKYNQSYQEYINNPTLEAAKALYIQHENIKYGFRNIKNLETSFNFDCTGEMYADILKNDLTSEKEKQLFNEFINSELEKTKVKKYEKDQKRLYDTEKKEASLKHFMDLRKKYGIKEATELIKIQQELSNYINVQNENSYGGRHHV